MSNSSKDDAAAQATATGIAKVNLQQDGGSYLRRNNGSSKANFEKREKRRKIRELQASIVNRNVPDVKMILNSDFDVDFQYNSQTSLQLAVCEGSYEICELLISKKANVNQTDADGNSLLNKACWRGFSEIAQLLIANGADVDSQNEAGNSSLNVCAHKGYSHIAEILCAAKCNMNLANARGHTPLFSVSQSGNVAMVRQLLKAMADPDWGDYIFKTPLMVAAEEGHLEVVQALLEGGADVNRQSRTGRTAAYEAACHGYGDILQVLVKYKANLNLCTTKGITPLLEAISSNHTEAARIIIQSGCNVNQADRTCWAPIHAVIRQVSNMFDPGDNIEMRKLVGILVDAGADVNKFDEENWTPLYQAASAGDYDLCKFLLERGAAVDKYTKKGSSVLHAAVYGGKLDIVRLCLDAGCQVNAVDEVGQHALLAAVSSRCDIKIIEALLDAGSDVNIAHNLTKQTALHEAVCQQVVSAARLLIDKGSSLSAVNCEQKSPLYLACWRGLVETVEYMLSKGCQTSSPSISGLPIHAAATQGRSSIIQILSDNGCNLNQMNEKGETPIIAALAEDNFSAVRALLQCGCDIEAHLKVKPPQICCLLHDDPHPHLGLDPLFLALTHKNMDMMKMLLQCYSVIPHRTIQVLEVLLRRAQGINTHYTPQQKKDIFDLFRVNKCTPFSLSDACRRCIRAALGSPMQQKVTHLPVGEKVKKYILMEAEFEVWQEVELDMPGGKTGFSDIFIHHNPY
ncbi:ankyrin repeat domain-containing protein 50-like [Physella acuta]|uniref:ankyrin repeat domain-containing protein 50-like n=1 Tax=Physella acuta TaxID=109671 RepID=UPI0027DC3D26|nr:ankyrin repeat domain-containing protein 50-like [Physella acuta]